MTLLVASNVVLWVLVLVLAAIVFALTRQIGVLHERIRPAGALMLQQDLKAGEPAPQLTVQDLRGDTLTVGAPAERGTLLFFLSTTCPMCKSLLPVLKAAAREEQAWLDVVLASDGERAEHEQLIAQEQLEEFPYVLSAELGMAFQVSKLPYAALIDDTGKLVSFGLVNNREHLESLFEAHALGTSSMQDYLATKAGGTDLGRDVA